MKTGPDARRSALCGPVQGGPPEPPAADPLPVTGSSQSPVAVPGSQAVPETGVRPAASRLSTETRTSQGSKALTRPSRDAMKKIRRRLADELRAMRGTPAAEVTYKLNPVIRGQANYYRSGASKKSFQSLDNYLRQQLYKWARRRHPKKGRRWVTARYFGQYCQHRRNRWVFGDRETGAYLHKYAWTKIVRHAPVPGRHSPYDPALAQFWADRRRKQKPPATGPDLAKSPAGPAGAVPAMPGTAAVRRPRARLPRPVGDLVRGRRQGDDPPGHHRHQHRPDETPPRARLLRPPPARRRTRRHGTADCTHLTALAGCLSRVPRRVASTVLRRGAPENGAPYPTSRCWRRPGWRCSW